MSKDDLEHQGRIDVYKKPKKTNWFAAIVEWIFIVFFGLMVIGLFGHFFGS